MDQNTLPRSVPQLLRVLKIIYWAILVSQFALFAMGFFMNYDNKLEIKPIEDTMEIIFLIVSGFIFSMNFIIPKFFFPLLQNKLTAQAVFRDKMQNIFFVTIIRFSFVEGSVFFLFMSSIAFSSLALVCCSIVYIVAFFFLLMPKPERLITQFNLSESEAKELLQA